MSLLKRLEEESQFLLEELRIRAAHYKQANGHVPDLIAEMIGHLEKQVESTSVVETPAPVVVIDTPVSVSAVETSIIDTPIADK